MGCFGVGILAKQKVAEGFLAKSSYDIDQILATDIVYEKEFQCKACDNFCPIRILNVNGHKYMFGGRCNKYANIRKKKFSTRPKSPTTLKNEMTSCLKNATLTPPHWLRKGFMSAFRAVFPFTRWPFYSWFFHTLG